MSADQVQAGQGPGLGGGFWPVDDGDVLPGDQYVLYSQGHFNDTPVLIGTNSDEGALFVRGGVTGPVFEKQIRGGYGERADDILAAYPHGTDEQALQSARNVFRDSAFAWPTWTWARLQSQKGKGAAYVYYFDHRGPQSPNGASHADELPYVFGTLGGPGRPAPRREDTRDVRARDGLLDELREDRQPERLGLAAVAGVHGERPACDGARCVVERATGAECAAARGVRRVLRVAPGAGEGALTEAEIAFRLRGENAGAVRGPGIHQAAVSCSARRS